VVKSYKLSEVIIAEAGKQKPFLTEIIDSQESIDQRDYSMYQLDGYGE
jgi:hypothetical protein